MSKTVMIVQDNELNMKLFHDLLEAYGSRRRYRSMMAVSKVCRRSFGIFRRTSPALVCRLRS